jgi:lipopolysaccharide transport system permease protein
MKFNLEAIPAAGSIDEALWDFGNGFRSWRLWLYFGALDVRQRYRRSSLGPLWLSLGLGVTILGIGLLYSAILKTPAGTFIPFLSISLLTWQYISSSISESTGVFQGAGSIITSMRVPYTALILRMLVRNAIVFLHCIPPAVIAFLFYRYPVHAAALFSIPGFILLTANLYWIALLVAILCLRFRDIAQIIVYGLQLAIFVTPIIWQPSKTTVSPALVRLNPLYHMVQVVRAPVFDGKIPVDSLIFCSGMLVVGLVLVFVVFRLSRRHIVHWL